MEDLRAQIQEAVSQDGTGWLEELLLSYRTAAGAAEPEGPGTQPRRASEASPVGGEQLRGRPQRRKQPPARLSPSPANKRRGMRSSRGEDEAAAAAKTGSKMAPGSKRLAGKRPATRQRSPPASGSRRIEAQPSSTASAAAAPSATGQRALAQKTAQTRSGAGMSQTEERGNTREGRVPRQHRRASQPERRAEGRQQKGRGTSRRGNITGTAATYSTPASTPASSPISSPASTPASSPTPDILSPGRAQRGRGSRFQGSRSPTQSPLAAGQASRSHGMPSYYGANRPESSLYPGQQRGSYTTQRPSRHTSVVQPPATSMQHRCFVNPRYLDPRLQETLGYASQVSANYASSSRQGQGARRRRRDRARAIRLESRRSGQLEQAGSASSSSSGRARADSRVDRSSSGEDRRDSDEHRHLLNVQVEPSSRDYRSYRSQGHSHGRSCGHQPGLAYQQRAQEATQKDSRQPTPDRRIRRRDTAGTSPLALPEVGRAAAEPWKIWIVGHSFVYWAERRAATRPPGRSLGLTDTVVNWYGVRGLQWPSLLKIITDISRWTPRRVILVVHAGGNDLGKIKLGDLLVLMKQDMLRFRECFQESMLVWSDIIGRRRWRGAKSPEAIENVRKVVNQRVSKFVHSLGGIAIRHWELEDRERGALRSDGVHLNEVGLDTFLSGLQDGVEAALARVRGVGRNAP
ncbi:serine/arginine repetitive matrix protein 1-like isoform X2 [Eleutherodactylus coqui]|uniref:serine/arginine repetitive matrix protein 1-like isoform X2 n=1 Tax=Eleutherodactylus coqui TaxID=57060 RepID=UPI0034631582